MLIGWIQENPIFSTLCTDCLVAVKAAALQGTVPALDLTPDTNKTIS